MKVVGDQLVGLEFGNAWQLRSQDRPETNWIVGSFPTIAPESLRFMQQSNVTNGVVGDSATDIAIKWFLHTPQDDPAWGINKPISSGRTLSLLAGAGEFELTFTLADQCLTLVLDQPGDFAIWGSGLFHAWRSLKVSPILTVRWRVQCDD
jgi:hypothetical protein